MRTIAYRVSCKRKKDRAWQIAGETDSRKEAQYLRWYMNSRGYIAIIEKI